MNYQQTFITVSPDSRVDHSVAPEANGSAKTVHRIQYELLRDHPYTYTGQELIFETHVRRLGLDEAEVNARRDELWQELFSKSHACLRASALAKKYGWGFHYDEHGRIGMYPVESPEYQEMSRGENPKLKILHAMRSQRA